MSLTDLFAKLFRDPMGGINYLFEAPMTTETAVGWAIVAFTMMAIIVFVLWILSKIFSR